VKKRKGFDANVSVIFTDSDEWKCEKCGQTNLKAAEFDTITRCAGCGRLTMVREKKARE